MFSARSSSSNSKASESLASWLQSRMHDLVRVTDENEFNRIFDDMFADNARFHVNGKDMGRDDAKKHMMERKRDQKSGDLSLQGLVAVPRDENKPEMGGYVGTFFTADITRKDNRKSRFIHCVNMEIEDTNNRAKSSDGRKITRVHEVSAESEHRGHN
ncbi:hypothetical protein AMATHDRAFT_8904 [Amanita thiersii Skay4041]|uniref:SnoaL-like domain-containing protein n=1 Tax=Amanita thiersii Skay4041 TaxID=703135 RepID=A0A2A9N6H1_9AGAR|nr:hypothetical protein AMATHDRAFT_8904 [Amanita thiersii Skay4041]